MANKPARRSWEGRAFDHAANAAAIQKDRDRDLWNRLARLLGVRGRDLAAAFGRLIETHLDRLLPAGPFVDDLRKRPADRLAALRTLIFELIAEDVAETFQILNQGTTHDTRDAEKATGSGQPSAPEHERPVETGDEEDEDQGGDARE